ncbi:MAG: DeoR/GlpR family DNA-binding transcription regulator [Floccifex sp.]
MRKTTEKRLEFIQSYLSDNKKATVKELSLSLNVTPEMVRKDLSYLEEKGILFRTHGGAILRESNVDVPLSIRSKEKMDVKRKLCLRVLDYIENDDVIFIDPSSTYLPLAQLLALKKNLVILTNCFNFMNSIEITNHDIYFLGGKYSKSGNRTKGQFQMHMIEKFNFDVALFGMDGFIGFTGAGTQSADAVFLNDEIMKRAKKKILVADSSKFDLTARYCYAKLSDFDVFITDAIPDAFKDKIPIQTIIELNTL